MIVGKRVVGPEPKKTKIYSPAQTAKLETQGAVARAGVQVVQFKPDAVDPGYERASPFLIEVPHTNSPDSAGLQPRS